MNPQLQRFLLPVVAAVAGAAITDLDAFAQARKADPATKFDWTLFGVRVFKAALMGATGGGAWASSTNPATPL